MRASHHPRSSLISNLLRSVGLALLTSTSWGLGALSDENSRQIDEWNATSYSASPVQVINAQDAFSGVAAEARDGGSNAKRGRVSVTLADFMLFSATGVAFLGTAAFLIRLVRAKYNSSR